ncbi:uncharacterized protein I206_102526 [Kwoniella pini CBS 10737]|uniref:Rho-GAP domain-containing protein n=1 Tax=Kwoniella pini CBS 10737 TaxID=1296096 RepID=A0A1B9I5M5_9TREE|nr:uncharacterized protein I206_02877 [Kwoniella pini CBS 10737]OCF50820.1 hypothetical protein I206_02877 [Kwoniella pini CBS 10737]
MSTTGNISSVDRDIIKVNSNRPLSEISENEQHHRSIIKSSANSNSNRSSVHNKSRPVSEVKEKEETLLHSHTSLASQSNNFKRMSSNNGSGLQTITLNLVEYAKSQSQSQPQVQNTTVTATSSSTPTINIPPILEPEVKVQNGSDKLTHPPSPTTKPMPPILPKRPESSSNIKGKEIEQTKDKDKGKEKKGSPKLLDKDLPETGETSRSGVSSFLLAKRASLRPSSLSMSYADVAKPVPSPPAATTTTIPSAFDSVDSLRTSSSSIPDTTKPPTKSKPSWLRRASGTAALRSKSRTPPPREDSSLPTSTSLPPALPPRKGLESTSEVPTSQSLPEEGMAPPPFPPRKTSYASAAAGPSRSRLGDGQGRPAFSPSITPPSLPSRDNIGNIRGRIAAWTAAAAQSSGGGFSRSESSNSIATQSSIGPSQRAQRVLGHAGSAVQKGWAGLRSRGVGGSISSMSALGQSSKRNGGNNGFEPSSSWGSGLSNQRSSRDRSRSDNYEFGHGGPPSSDGPFFEQDSVRRSAEGLGGKVFGRDVVGAGKDWGIVEDDIGADLGEYDRRRKACLPAVVVRSVEYLQIWGPQEEGIFRISGRSSHIAKLRKEFDSGADIDLTKCHPGDLDPHAVAGLFKSYLRELPSPLLTHQLGPQFDSYMKGKGKAVPDRAGFNSTVVEDDHLDKSEDLSSLLEQLPQAHWFLLADIVKLLDLIPRHSSTNRMTQNALMLSLGPSLNIPGGILNELIEKREYLFAEPPTPTALETAEALIDFGDISIPPVTPLAELPPTPAATANLDNHTAPPSAPYLGSTKSKKAPRLPAKPSLTRLFTSSSHTSLPRQKSVDTLNSIINTEPPRVDVPLSPASPLPSFEPTQSDGGVAVPPQSQEAAQNPLSLSTMNKVPIPETPNPSSSDKMEEVHYPSGTVDERSKLFSTPIADRFQGTSSPFPALRQPRSSNGSTLTLNSSASDGNLSRTAQNDSVNAVRRGAPVFFSSAGVVERHNSSHGHGHTRSVSASANSALSGNSTSKQESDSALEERQKRSNSEEIDDRKEKRLSAGPDNVRIRDFTV